MALLLIMDSGAISSEARPNVIFILADDLGWSDTTLFGATKFYQTPNGISSVTLARGFPDTSSPTLRSGDTRTNPIHG